MPSSWDRSRSINSAQVLSQPSPTSKAIPGTCCLLPQPVGPLGSVPVEVGVGPPPVPPACRLSPFCPLTANALALLGRPWPLGVHPRVCSVARLDLPLYFGVPARWREQVTWRVGVLTLPWQPFPLLTSGVSFSRLRTHRPRHLCFSQTRVFEQLHGQDSLCLSH